MGFGINLEDLIEGVSMINGIKPDVTTKTKVGSKVDFDGAMTMFLNKLTLDAKPYIERFDHMLDVKFDTAGGRKYIKVKYYIMNENGMDKGSIHCFVDSTTGDIYKPATWRAPYTKGNNAVRGNIFDSSTYQKTDMHGGWLYV